MAEFTLTATLPLAYDEAVARVRVALADAGFGVLTEIDLRATVKAKLDVDVAPQVILGACRPQLAHQALQANPSVAALLPCNVVVRSLDEGHSVVEAFDPDVMSSLLEPAPQARLRARRPARPRTASPTMNRVAALAACSPSSGSWPRPMRPIWCSYHSDSPARPATVGSV